MPSSSNAKCFGNLGQARTLAQLWRNKTTQRPRQSDTVLVFTWNYSAGGNSSNSEGSV